MATVKGGWIPAANLEQIRHKLEVINGLRTLEGGEHLTNPTADIVSKALQVLLRDLVRDLEAYQTDPPEPVDSGLGLY